MDAFPCEPGSVASETSGMIKRECPKCVFANGGCLKSPYPVLSDPPVVHASLFRLLSRSQKSSRICWGGLKIVRPSPNEDQGHLQGRFNGRKTTRDSMISAARFVAGGDPADGFEMPRIAVVQKMGVNSTNDMGMDDLVGEQNRCS